MSSGGAEATDKRGLARTLGQAFLCLALLVAILPKGATETLALLLACVPIGLALLLAALSPSRSESVGRVTTASLVLATILSAYVLFQAWQFPGNPFANPIWARLNELLGTNVAGSVSVEPSATKQALVTLLAPILTYVSVMRLFDSDADALRLLKVLAAVGIGFALFGLFQIEFAPNSLLFFQKEHYRGSLTSVFVNRNTAGTLLGVASFAVLIWLVRLVRQTGGTKPLLRLLLDTSIDTQHRFKVGLLLGAFLAVIAAMFLTQSRGAMLSTLAGYLIVVPMLLLDRSTRHGPNHHGHWPSARTLAFIAAGVLIVLTLAQLLGERSTARLGSDGIDAARLCVYDATWRAFKDNWMFGAGFGTFDSVFPSYRRPDCGPVYESFLRAHNFYLEGLLGLGIVFVPIILATYWYVLRILSKGLRDRRSLRFVPTIGLGAVVLVTIHSITDFSLQIPGMAFYFAAFLGAVSVICLGRDSKRPRSKPRMPKPETETRIPA